VTDNSVIDLNVVIQADDYEVMGAVILDHEVTGCDPSEMLRQRWCRVLSGALDEARQCLGERPSLGERQKFVGCERGLKISDVPSALGEQLAPVADLLGPKTVVEATSTPREVEFTRVWELLLLGGSSTRQGGLWHS